MVKLRVVLLGLGVLFFVLLSFDWYFHEMDNLEEKIYGFPLEEKSLVDLGEEYYLVCKDQTNINVLVGNTCGDDSCTKVLYDSVGYEIGRFSEGEYGSVDSLENERARSTYDKYSSCKRTKPEWVKRNYTKID